MNVAISSRRENTSAARSPGMPFPTITGWPAKPMALPGTLTLIGTYYASSAASLPTAADVPVECESGICMDLQYGNPPLANT